MEEGQRRLDQSMLELISTSFIAGFTIVFGIVALGPFKHVIVTTLHLFFGILFGATIGLGTVATLVVVVTAGNFVGGIGLVTLTHVTQAMGSEESSEAGQSSGSAGSSGSGESASGSEG